MGMNIFPPKAVPNDDERRHENVRVYLADLINRTESGNIEPTLSGKLGYLISILVRVIEGGDLEKRIKNLEDKSNVFKK